MAENGRTIDPSQIDDPSQIPPNGAVSVGLSSQGLVDVYCGTLLGDIDAQASAKELLAPAPDTGGLANADYIYNQVSALYGKVPLPTLKGPSGSEARALVFVSGASQGSYGAFHISGSADRTAFDRIVVDSLEVSGNYSPDSGLGSAIASEGKAPKGRTGLFKAYHGPADLLAITHALDPRLKAAKSADIERALAFAKQSMRALAKSVETRNVSTLPGEMISLHSKEAPHERLTRTNRDVQGLLRAALGGSGGREYLSTALFAAEIVESFQVLTQNADPGKTNGEAVSRVVGFKLAPEISLIPGFNSAVVQQWWLDRHTDFVNVNSEDDRSPDGNGAGMMFLQFINDYLGVPLDKIIQHMPNREAPLGETYVALQPEYSNLAEAAGATGKSAFEKMISLLQTIQNADGTLNLPANGNPFPAMDGAKQGGLFAPDGPGSGTATTAPLAQDTQASLQLLTQLEQQVAALRGALEQVQQDLSGAALEQLRRDPSGAKLRDSRSHQVVEERAEYGPPLVASVLAKIEQQVATYRAPQYDQTLRQEFWPHVYNELPGTGPRTDRLQVVTGTIQSPEAVQITGTIIVPPPKHEDDGDLHISFRPDDPQFPSNHDSQEPPLEIEIIYAGPVKPGRKGPEEAKGEYQNPFDIKPLQSGTRIQVAGPLIFDTAHGRVDVSGNIQFGLEIHPAVAVNVLSGDGTPGHVPPPEKSGLPADLASVFGQGAALKQAVGNLTALLQKMKDEAPASSSSSVARAQHKR